MPACEIIKLKNIKNNTEKQLKHQKVGEKEINHDLFDFSYDMETIQKALLFIL